VDQCKQGYDFIIVGAGSAGWRVAIGSARAGDATVLPARGGGRERHPLIHIPLGLGRMHAARHVRLGLPHRARADLNGRRIEAMRARCWAAPPRSTVMAFTRGHPGDYDRWAQKGARRLGPMRDVLRTSNAA